MSEQRAQYDAPLAVGTRVREREGRADGPPRVGTVVDDATYSAGHVLVRWDGDPSGALPWAVSPLWLEGVEPAPVRATERDEGEAQERNPDRMLGYGIVQADDTCGGLTRIAGTRLTTAALSAYWWRELGEGHGPGTAARHVAGDHQTTPEAVARAVAFESGRSYERERRKVWKARRRARRYERGKAASEGVRDAPQ